MKACKSVFNQYFFEKIPEEYFLLRNLSRPWTRVRKTIVVLHTSRGKGRYSLRPLKSLIFRKIYHRVKILKARKLFEYIDFETCS